MKKISLLFLLFLAACTTKTAIDPQVKVNATDFGNSWKVWVKVEDVQNAKLFGQRQWGEGEDAIAPQDVRKVVEEKSGATLEKLGFSPVYAEEGAFRELAIQISRLEYKLTPAPLLSSEMEGALEFKVSAKNREDVFSQTYSIVKKKQLPLRPSQSQNLAFLESALGDMLESIFQDEELLHFLSQE